MNEHEASMLRGISNDDQDRAALRDIVGAWTSETWAAFREFVASPCENANDFFLKLCCLTAVRGLILEHDQENLDTPG